MDTLQERRKQAEQRFNDLIKQKEVKEDEIMQLNNELVMLKGEYRVLDELIAAQPTPVEEANTINVEEPDAQA